MSTTTTINCRFSNLDGFLEQFNSPNHREATQLWKVIPDGAVELRLTTDCPLQRPHPSPGTSDPQDRYWCHRQGNPDQPPHAGPLVRQPIG